MAAELILISGGVTKPLPQPPMTKEQISLLQDAAAFDLCVTLIIVLGAVLVFRGRNARRGDFILQLIGLSMMIIGSYTFLWEGIGLVTVRDKAAWWRYFAALPPYILTILGVATAASLFMLRKWRPGAFGVAEIAAGGLAVWFAKIISGGHVAGILIGFVSGSFLMAAGMKTALDNLPDNWKTVAPPWLKHLF